MALTEIPSELSSTPSIVDNGNATAITIDASENATFAGAVDVTGAMTVDTNTLVVDATNNRVGIGTSSLATKLTVSGGYISQTDGTISTYLGSDGTGSLFGTTTNHYLRFLTNNTERMRIDGATGNVGIGVVPSAAYKMQVNVATNTVSTGSPAASSLFNIAGGTTTVGNGVSLQLSNTSGAKETAWRISAVTTSGNNGDLVFNGYAGGADYPERMRIDGATGNLLVGTTAVDPAGNNTAGMSVGTGGGLSVQGTASALTIGVPSAQDYGMAFRFQGSLAGRIGIAANNITVADVSDYRLKENVAPLADALTKIKALKPLLYNFINDPDKTHEGFIAHELQEVIPYAVSGEKDALITEATKDRGTVGEIDPQAVDLRKLVPTLVAAIQEQQATIEALTTRLTALENN